MFMQCIAFYIYIFRTVLVSSVLTHVFPAVFFMVHFKILSFLLKMVSDWLNGRKIRIELKLQGFEYRNRVATASFTGEFILL